MPVDEKNRRQLDLGGSNEPAEELGLLPTSIPSALQRRPSGRETKVRPAERRRRSRQLSVTFSTPAIPERLRALAERWGLTSPDPARPNFSAVVEHLVMLSLDAAERGEIDPPSAGSTAEAQQKPAQPAGYARGKRA